MPLPWLAPTLNFPISCWHGALAPVPGGSWGAQDGAQQHHVLLCAFGLQRGQGAVSRGGHIPPAVLGCLDGPNMCCSKQAPAWGHRVQCDSGTRGRVLGFSGMVPGDTVLACEDLHPRVSEEVAHIDQRFHFSHPSGIQSSVPSLCPAMGRCSALPGGASEAAEQDPQALGTQVDPGECSCHPEGAGRNVRNGAHTFLPSFASISVSHSFSLRVKVKFCQHLPVHQ